jgi:LPXTG-motif cell wall-anchored protein
VAPTSAAPTTDPATLPATGGSDASAFIAVAVLAVGAFLLIVARKFRET